MKLTLEVLKNGSDIEVKNKEYIIYDTNVCVIRSSIMTDLYLPA
jgi:hypothetical protein